MKIEYVVRTLRRKHLIQFLLGSLITSVLFGSAVDGSALPREAVGVQLVVVEVNAKSATSGFLHLVERRGGVEKVIFGPVAARVGRTGVKAVRREGDGSTPLGETAIVSAFGMDRRPVVRLPYRRLRAGDCWISDASDSAYNQWARRSKCRKPNEDLHRIGTAGPYEFGLVTSFNTDPIIAGAGSAIFIHVHSFTSGGKTTPTSGCISVARSAMKRLFTLLDPAMTPRLVVQIQRRA